MVDLIIMPEACFCFPVDVSMNRRFFFLLHEFQRVSLESLLAGNAAKMIRIAVKGDFEFGSLFV
jgi:hypothetical protein